MAKKKEKKKFEITNPFKISEKKHKQIIENRQQKTINAGELAKRMVESIPEQSQFNKQLEKERKWLYK